MQAHSIDANVPPQHAAGAARPAYHFKPYNDKKDRGRPRTKVKKYKSLKSTRKINVQ